MVQLPTLCNASLAACPCFHTLQSYSTPRYDPPPARSRQKYRLYLRRLGGLSDRDRVDADALQRLHEVRLA